MTSLLTVDHDLFDYINSHHSAWLDTVMLAASHVGVGGGVWLAIAAIAAVFPARRQAAWRLALVIGLASLIVNAFIKPAVGRERPYQVMSDIRVIDAQPGSSSFPSGHAANAMAGAAAASSLLPGATLVWCALGITIAISRIYVGVHFPIDVLAGAILGLLCAYFALHDVKRYGARFQIGPKLSQTARLAER